MVTTRANMIGVAEAPNLDGNQELTRRIAEKGDWFHNINLNGVWTAPHHFLGDFPNVKWKHISPALPADLSGATVFDVGSIPGQFDYVLFMGVFYHLRYPLFALDKVIKKVKGSLIFQTMVRGSLASPELREDYHFWNMEIFKDPDFPCMYFIEKNYAGDPTNWWIPNHGAMEGMLRSSGLEITSHPEQETWICAPSHVTKDDGKYLLDHELAGTL